LKIRHLQI